MNLRFYNARILTMEDDRPVFEGELWIRGERILYVGPSGETEHKPDQCVIWDEEIDCKGNLLMPGFKNAHTHSGMTFLRSFADDLPLDEWLNRQVFPMEAQLSAEDIYHLTKLAILEYLSGGITAIFDMYLTPDTIAQACVDMGMRCVQTGSVNNFSQSPALLAQWYEGLNQKDPLLSFLPGFHAEYTCSPELLRKIAGLVKEWKSPVYTHLSETEKEVKGCVARHGMTPLRYLDSLGMFDCGGGVYHGVWLTEEEILLCKEKQISVITCPASNAKLASGIAPVTALLKAGVNVAIGTDGPASNNCLDFFREMFLVTGLAKLKERDASVVDAMEVLRMATVSGAKAMRLYDADLLAKGRLADLILIDLWQPNMQPLNHIAKNIVYSGSRQNIKMTVIHGKILYRDGRFLTKDQPEDIYQKANKIIKRLRG